MQIFLINLKADKKNEAKKANMTVRKTITAPMATPGPAYAWTKGGKKIFKQKINKNNLKTWFLEKYIVKV